MAEEHSADPSVESREAEAPIEETAAAEASAMEAPPHASEEPAEPYRPTPSPNRQPASEQAVQKAIEQVNDIIETLRDTLDEMEGVLETLELAERQKNADEHEIETLRRSLKHLQRPREERRPFREGQGSSHGPSHGHRQ
ncbi:MAG TPA: hypothetical protein VHH88_13495 [Verrucomicrobiae bacterium]|nr:hypothetical protein [Verrucomicrobiae bacterium]